MAEVRGDTGIGHVPRKTLSICFLYLRWDGSIVCCVTGSRWFSADLAQGGLEGDISRSFDGIFNRCRANVCRQGSTRVWNGAHARRLEVPDSSRSKFDLIKILNAKYFVVFIFVWPAIIWNIRKFAPIQNSHYTVYAWEWRDWFCLWETGVLYSRKIWWRLKFGNSVSRWKLAKFNSSPNFLPLIHYSWMLS